MGRPACTSAAAKPSDAARRKNAGKNAFPSAQAGASMPARGAQHFSTLVKLFKLI